MHILDGIARLEFSREELVNLSFNESHYVTH